MAEQTKLVNWRCPGCGSAPSEYGRLWINLWPFNFEHVDCARCGPVSTEDWLWDRLFGAMHFFTPWTGEMHTRRHPWWTKFIGGHSSGVSS